MFMACMSKNQNRLKKESSIKSKPIRQKTAIGWIKAALLHHGKYLDHHLFTLGINTANRTNEILSISTERILGTPYSIMIKVKYCVARISMLNPHHI